ncbi:MAG: tail fiber domain-containing protein [Phycisphaerales bacterium]
MQERIVRSFVVATALASAALVACVWTLRSDGDVARTPAAPGTVFSDARLKENVKPLEPSLSDVLALEPVTFHYKSGSPSGQQIGFIAQDVERLVPEAVTRGDEPEHYLSLSYPMLVPVVVKAVQEEHQTIETHTRQIRELQTVIESLVAKLSEQQTQLTALEKRVAELEKAKDSKGS